MVDHLTYFHRKTSQESEKGFLVERIEFPAEIHFPLHQFLYHTHFHNFVKVNHI